MTRFHLQSKWINLRDLSIACVKIVHRKQILLIPKGSQFRCCFIGISNWKIPQVSHHYHLMMGVSSLRNKQRRHHSLNDVGIYREDGQIFAEIGQSEEIRMGKFFYSIDDPPPIVSGLSGTWRHTSGNPPRWKFQIRSPDANDFGKRVYSLSSTRIKCARESHSQLHQSIF